MVEERVSAKALRQELLRRFEEQQNGPQGWKGARGTVTGQAAGEWGMATVGVS